MGIKFVCDLKWFLLDFFHPLVITIKTIGLVKNLLGFNFLCKITEKNKINSQKDILGFTVNCYICADVNYIRFLKCLIFLIRQQDEI